MVAVAAESMVGGTRLVSPEAESSEFSGGLCPQRNWRTPSADALPQVEYRLTTPSTLSRGARCKPAQRIPFSGCTPKVSLSS